jgi:hypothetical protein
VGIGFARVSYTVSTLHSGPIRGLYDSPFHSGTPTISMAVQRTETLIDWKKGIDSDGKVRTLRKRYLIDPVEAIAVMLGRL